MKMSLMRWSYGPGAQEGLLAPTLPCVDILAKFRFQLSSLLDDHGVAVTG